MVGGAVIRRARTLPRALAILLFVAALAASLPAAAQAVDPETAVGGAGSKWFSGTLEQLSGENCSILGGAYSETMLSAIGGYGGAPGGQLVKVGDRYYAEVLISIPGNPCGSGSSFVGTDLLLPRGTSVDPSAPIRCFGQPRSSSTFGELTGGNWSFTFQDGRTSTGPYCPTHVGPSLTGTSGAVGVGYRPLASGQLYEVFVPVKSTQTLQGAGANPADEITWVTSSSATYVNLGATSVWANVVPAGSGAPFIYFARNPSVVPFWLGSAAPGTENRAEWFANLYSAGLQGTLCFDLYDGPVAGVGSPTNCSADPNWNSAIAAGPDTWQVFGDGPNGGFVPFAYAGASTYTIRWRFTYNGGTQFVTKDISFTTLSGPDTDGDGVPDATDACPAVKGTLANGCQPPVQTDPDGDGIFGSADACPTQNGEGSLNGCPVHVTPADRDGDGVPDSRDRCPTVAARTADGCPAAPAVLKGTLGTIAHARLSRKALAQGVRLSVRCTLGAKARAALTVNRTVAKRLKLTLRRGQKTVTIASASGGCVAGKAGRVTLKLVRANAKKVRRPRGGFGATLTLVLTRKGSKPVTIRRTLKLT